MRRNFLPVLLVAIAALAPRGQAQLPTLSPTLAGVFEYPHDEAHGRAIVETALEPRLAAVPSLFRGIVRDQLDQRIVIPRRITVVLPATDPNVSVTYESERTTTVASPVGGSTTVTSPSGESIPVAQTAAGGWLRQVFTGENGQLRVLLSTEPDGATLHVDATIESGRLGDPVPVRLDYSRVP